MKAKSQSRKTLLTLGMVVVWGFSLSANHATASAGEDNSEKIVFTIHEGAGDIYVMDPDGSNLTTITNTPTLSEGYPRWSPDGTKISFYCETDIWTMNRDGSDRKNLTQTPDCYEEPHSWSPDGSEIVYSRRFGLSRDERIYVMDAEGTYHTELTSGHADGHPCWSPDGTRIVFDRSLTPGQPISHWQIYVMNADGTDVHRITYTGDDDIDPAWSPDGSQIVFTSSRGGNYYRNQIYVGDFSVGPDGVPQLLNQTNITNNQWRYAAPRWSPDGNRIAYGRAWYNTSDYDIWVSNADGSSPIQLTNTPGIPEVYPDWAIVNQPPVAVAGLDQVVEATGPSGASITLDGSGSTDDGQIQPLTYTWTWTGGSATGVSPVVTLPLGTTTVTLSVYDGEFSDTDTVEIQVVDTTPPEITVVAPDPYGLYADGDLVLDFSATDLVDGEILPPFLWGELIDADGFSGSVVPGDVPGAGIYTLTVTAEDQAGNLAAETVMFVVYDPTDGFVTGGGWIWSGAGAYVDDPGLEGKANFGFVSKYKKGATAPTGQTEFVFHAGDLNFHSSSYEWLVVTGSDYARFKGWGAINGGGDYRFMLWAGDSPDTFRIRIWEEDEVTGEESDVYDNGTDQEIGGGSIVVHVK